MRRLFKLYEGFATGWHGKGAKMKGHLPVRDEGYVGKSRMH
jgi:hypothetical protein